MKEISLQEISEKSRTAVAELLDVAKPKPGDIVVVGCSTSEVVGKRIGSSSAIDVAESILDAILPLLQEKQVCLAAQCCEHLNRALVMESECAETNGFEIVSVVPQIKAGGAFATEFYRRCRQPVVVEEVRAVAGVDIGDTFIGMHIKNVVIPIRGTVKEIGFAHVTMACRRPKLIGGQRSVYTKTI